MTVSLTKTPIIIDKTRALDLLAQAVEVKGADHVQNACYYVVGETQWEDEDTTTLVNVGYGCMVGTALALAKPSVMQVFAQNEALNEESFDNIVSDLPVLLGIEVTDEAAVVFQTAQWAQDGRNGWHTHQTWGEALDAARNAE